MNEWTVVTVIVVLSGLVISFVKPLISLNGTLTRLTEAVRVLERELAGISEKNSEAHARLWQKMQAQDGVLADHEKRISRMERE